MRVPRRLHLLTPARLLTIRRAPRLLACVGFELVSQSDHEGERQARRARCGARCRLLRRSARCRGRLRRRAHRCQYRRCLGCRPTLIAGSLYRPRASQPRDRTLRIGGWSGVRGCRLWRERVGRARDSRGAAWAVLDNAVEHERHFEFGARVRRHISSHASSREGGNGARAAHGRCFRSEKAARHSLSAFRTQRRRRRRRRSRRTRGARARALGRARVFARQMRGMLARHLDRRKDNAARPAASVAGACEALLARCAALAPPVTRRPRRRGRRC